MYLELSPIYMYDVALLSCFIIFVADVFKSSLCCLQKQTSSQAGDKPQPGPCVSYLLRDDEISLSDLKTNILIWQCFDQNQLSVWRKSSDERKKKTFISLFLIISLKIIFFSPWYGWKIAQLTFNNNHSLNLCTSLKLNSLMFIYISICSC